MFTSQLITLSVLTFIALLSIIPALLAFILIAKRNKNLWFSFIFGGVGWIGALILRLIPLQVPILFYDISFIITNIYYFAYTALLAGVFEEVVRYILLSKIRLLRLSLKNVLSLGLGWGFMEALLIYVFGVLPLIYLGYNLTLMDILLGMVERNIAILLHVSLTFIVFSSFFAGKKLLLIAVTFHSIVDFIALYFFRIMNLPLWHVELAVLLVTLLVTIHAYTLIMKAKVKANLLLKPAQHP
ncbi:MAG: YhfC family intramembrane metalloprotease [Candidatus Bathyarchaeota archaeon]|nr:YhfC family intramembrane metalloprotease [Candidatus Bathyarchaeota archaeon]